MKRIMKLVIASLSVVLANQLVAADMSAPLSGALSEDQHALGQELVKAATQGNEKRVQEILLLDPSVVNAQDKDGYTALISASLKGYTAIVEKLLAHGANVDIQNTQERCERRIELTLMLAAAWGNREIVEKDIQKFKERGGLTALILAVAWGHEEIVSRLLEAGADLNIKDNYGNTALVQAILTHRPAIVATLLQHKADIHVQNNLGQTALEIARSMRHDDIVELLEWQASIVPEEEDTMIKPAVSE